MAKRQNFIVGSTNANTQTMTVSELNNAWNHNALLKSAELDGTFYAVSDFSNDSSNEIANAIKSITGSDPAGNSQSELAGALQQMRSEIETTSLTFKGYVATSAPSSSTYALVEGNIWINSATMPTSFPVAASSIKKWNGSSWVNYGSSYTPADFDFFRNINDNEGYYWFGGIWTVMSTDMSTAYFTLNQSTGKWEIKSSVNLPGNPTTTTPATNDNTTKIATTAWVNSNCGADKDLSKLSSTGKNIGNWSNNVTNCITEIPQDINLSVSSGHILLASGSKVYYPNGSGVFDSYTLPSIADSGDVSSITTDYLFFLSPTHTIAGAQRANCYSGTTAPTGANGVVWYDTTNNVIKRHNGTSWVSGYSLPFCVYGQGLVEKQVFKGFGYIGSHNFRLPGLAGLAPNGKNADGTLKNTKWTLTSVRVDQAANGTGSYMLIGGNTALRNQVVVTYFEQPTRPTVTAQYNAWYDTENNYIYYTNDTGATWVLQPNVTILGIEQVTSGKINSWDTKKVFQAVDYNDFVDLSNEVVRTSGDQTISDTKTFSDGIKTNVIESIVPQTSIAIARCSLGRYANQGYVSLQVNNGATGLLSLLELHGNAAFAPPSDLQESIVTTSAISKAQNGYVKLGNGLIIQWGIQDLTVSTTVSLPTAMSNTDYQVCVSGVDQYAGERVIQLYASDFTTTSFGIWVRGDQTTPVRWIAIGYWY